MPRRESGKSGDDFVARNIGGAARKLHAVLGDEALQQIVHTAHHLRIAVQFVRTVLLNGLDAHLFDVPRDNPGEGTTQVGGQHFHRIDPGRV